MMQCIRRKVKELHMYPVKLGSLPWDNPVMCLCNMINNI